MARIEPFTFNLSFDPEDIAARRRDKARQAELAAMAEEDRAALEAEAPPMFTVEELEAARQTARSEGEEAGREIERQAIEARAVEIAEQLFARADALAEELAALERRLKSDSSRLAAAVVATLMPVYARIHGLAEIEGAIARATEGRTTQVKMVARVPADLVAPIQQRMTGGSAQSLAVLPGIDLGPSDCIVEWSDGGIERNVATLMKEIVAVLGSPEPLADEGEDQ